MGWDSNPRGACTPAGFQDRCLQPLGHPSGTASPCLTWGRAARNADLPRLLRRDALLGPAAPGYRRQRRGYGPEDRAMKHGMVIIDADGHAVDAEPIYRERLPERYRKRNFIHPSDGFDRNQNGAISRRPETPAQNLADNDREGIDLQIIYPTGGLFLSRVREADYAIALSRTYNDWLYDWC